MKLSNRIISIASAAVLSLSTLTFNASAYSSASSGTESNLTIYGTSYTIVCLNHRGRYYVCNVDVKKMGKGNGKIRAYVSRGTKQFKHDFSEEENYPVYSSPEEWNSTWSVDLQNTKLTGKRTGAEVGWEFG